LYYYSKLKDEALEQFPVCGTSKEWNPEEFDVSLEEYAIESKLGSLELGCYCFGQYADFLTEK
jgi:hypothetical protein